MDKQAKAEEWLDTLSEDEILALKIAYNFIKPDKNHSRSWALSTAKSLLQQSMLAWRAEIASKSNKIKEEYEALFRKMELDEDCILEDRPSKIHITIDITIR